MRAFRLVFASVFTLSILSLGLAFAPRAFAEPVDHLICYYEQNQSGNEQRACDLALDKQVSVNGGEPVHAETADQAQNVTVGDTVTWTITFSNNSTEEYYPCGQVTVDDVLPSGVSLTNSLASTGEYNQDNGQWTFTLGNFCNQDNQDFSQATLTLTTTATTAGLIENTASLSEYNPCFYEGEPGTCEDPPYIDANSANNSHSAYINVAAKTTPVSTVSTTPKAPNTGFGVAQTNPLAVIATGVGGASTLATLGYLVRKNALRLSKIKS
jgi:uncharacterized repeat protein (TIGR01451 family)